MQSTSELAAKPAGHQAERPHVRDRLRRPSYASGSNARSHGGVEWGPRSHALGARATSVRLPPMDAPLRRPALRRESQIRAALACADLLAGALAGLVV